MEEVIALTEELAKPFEGLHKVYGDGLVYPYFDPVGFPTQGYGRLLSRQKWAPLSQWPAVTKEVCEMWLAEDLAKALRSVVKLVKVPCSDSQLAALTDFAFNCGAGNLQISTLLRRLNRGDYEGASDEFGKWVLAQGIRLPGLVRRRAAERELFLS